MHKCVLAPVFAVLLTTILPAPPVQAQATRTWVSGVGDDANPCSRTAPCKTFAGAIGKTIAGGIINCIDPGGFGAVTVTKSITIDCAGTYAGVLASGTNGVNIPAAAGSIVTLRNLHIEGAPPTIPGSIGISVTGGAIVHVENCKIFGFRGGSAIGIRYTAPAGAAGELYVSDTVIADNGTSATNGGIVITATGTGSVKAVLSRILVQNNSSGIRVDGTGSTGGISVALRDSVSAGNTANGVTGIMPAGGTARVNVQIDRGTLASNGAAAVQADGANSFVFVGGTLVTDNNTGFSSINSGGLFSFNNNSVRQNANNGTPLPAANIVPLN